MSKEFSTTFDELTRAGDLLFGDGYRTKQAELGRPGFPILRVAEVQDGYINPGYVDHVKESYRDKMGQKISRTGDVVLTTKGTVGRVARIPQNSQDFIYSPQVCYFRSTNESRLDQDYLYHWFRSPEFWNQASHKKSQTDMADYLSLTDIRSMRITLPEKRVQKSISRILSALDRKIAVNARIMETSNSISTCTFLKTRPGRLKSIGSVSFITMGQSPPGETLSTRETGTPFFQGNRDFGLRYPTKRISCSAATRIARAGDILVSVRAPVGEINIAAENCGIGRGLAAVRATSHPHVMLQALTAEPSIWSAYNAEGTVFGSINKAQLTQLKIRYPEHHHLDSLETKLRAFDSQIRGSLAEIGALAALRDTLLPQLMSGKLRVRDAERIVEDAV